MIGVFGCDCRATKNSAIARDLNVAGSSPAPAIEGNTMKMFLILAYEKDVVRYRKTIPARNHKEAATTFRHLFCDGGYDEIAVVELKR